MKGPYEVFLSPTRHAMVTTPLRKPQNSLSVWDLDRPVLPPSTTDGSYADLIVSSLFRHIQPNNVSLCGTWLGTFTKGTLSSPTPPTHVGGSWPYRN